MNIQRGFKKIKIANPMVIARDGVEALDCLRGRNGKGPVNKPYMILLDLNMPRMNGIEFLEEIRKDPDHKEALVFVMTTSKRDEDRVAAYQSHVAGYIIKSDIANGFMKVVEMIDKYWRIVEFP